MKLRRQFLPQTIGDTIGFSFFILILPLGYWFTVFIVIPTVVPKSSVSYLIHFIWSTFLLLSIVSNFIYLVFTDCSVSQVVKPENKTLSWKYCDNCFCESPPRSWHCDTCKTCVLKRDHHCRFSGCCIGHQNHRFFIMFLAYLSVGTLYSVYFILYHLWSTASNLNFNVDVPSILKLMFPFATFVLQIDTTEAHISFIMLLINVIGLLLSFSLFIYHFSILLKGAVMFEYSHGNYEYDLGSWKENIKQVFGNRWYISWLSPFIKSTLPNDGFDWDTVKLKGVNCK